MSLRTTTIRIAHRVYFQVVIVIVIVVVVIIVVVVVVVVVTTASKCDLRDVSDAQKVAYSTLSGF